VADACSGLRYLFPLMTLGFIAAYLFNAPLWQRAIIFLSTIPLTVGMNSLRIGIIGVTVNFWGIQMAEGFLHFFEGWIIFMACMTLLLAEMWLLLRFTKPRRTLRDAFVLEPPAPVPPGAVVRDRSVPRTLWIALGLLANAAATGGLSKPHPRYQARLVWLLPAAALLLLPAPRYATGMAARSAPR
jgi:exosortase/archaeosortase family protein